MREYRYLGRERLELGGYGVVYPKDVIKVDFEINHPLFEEIKKEAKANKKRNH